MTIKNYVDYYGLLGLQHSATADEIRVAYKSLALRWHPDRHTEKKDEASMRFVEVNDAYRFLSNQRRRELEQDGISGTSVQQASPSTPSKSDIDKLKRSNDSSNNGRQTPRMKSAPNFKVFEQKSEEPEKEPRGTPPKPRKPRPKSTPDGRAEYLSSQYSVFEEDPAPPHTQPEGDQSRDEPSDDNVGTPISSITVPAPDEVPSEWIFPIALTLQEIRRGATQRYRITRHLLSGKTGEVVIDVDIQPGWRKGTKIRFPHLGNERKGELPQDIVFVIEEIPHDRFTRVGSDLVTEAEISLAEALACDGGVYKLVDLDGRYVKIPLPTGIIRPGDETKVVGRGLPIRKAGKIIGKGDIIVKWAVKFPENLSKSQRKGLKSVLLL